MAETNFLTRAIVGFKEALTGFLTTITSDHRYIHEGKAFGISLSLGSTATPVYVAITTPAATAGYVHFRPNSAGVTSSAQLVTYKAQAEITSYTGGTAYTPFNRNRNSTRASAAVVKYGAITPTVGSAITFDTFQVGTAGNPTTRAGGMSGGGNDEMVFLPESVYLFTFTPVDTTVIDFNVFWYEETYGSV